MSATAPAMAKPEVTSPRQTSIWSALLNASNFATQVDPGLFVFIDWNRLIHAAEYHGVLPIIAQRILESSVRESLPPETEQALRRAYQASLMKSLPLVQEVLHITKAFRDTGIPIIPYKGPALAERYWGSFALRECVDLDFLVAPRNVERAGEILRELGYVRVAELPSHLHPALVKNASEEQFQHRDTKLLLELQWAPSPRVFALPFGTESMWKHTQVGELAGEPILSPSPEELLLLLCIHGWKHNWSRLIWVGDVAQLLRRDSFDWDCLMESASQHRSMGVLTLGLQIAHQLFGCSLPPVCLVIEPQIVQLADELIDRMRQMRRCTYIEWHRFMLAARDSRFDQLRQMSQFVITPGLGEYATVALPATLKGAYPLIRLARLLRLIPGKAKE